MNIKCLHLLSRPNDIRECRSVASVAPMCHAAGMEYYPIINPPYAGPIPPRMESDRTYESTPGHYGCYLAHRDAILKWLRHADAILVCECDCLFTIDSEEMKRRLARAAEACKEVPAFTFGYRHDGKTVRKIGDDVIVITQFIETHCYYVPRSSLPIFEKLFASPWDCYDIALTVYLNDRWGMPIGAWADKPIAVQADGASLTHDYIRNDEAHCSNQHNAGHDLMIEFGGGGVKREGWICHDYEVRIEQPLPYPGNCAKFVYASHVAEHVTCHEAFGFFKEVYRILQPGGVFRVVVPELSRITDRTHAVALIVGHGHQNVFGPESLAGMLFAAGFDWANIRQTEIDKEIDKHHLAIGYEKDLQESLRIEARK